jgi:hypothetical protein
VDAHPALAPASPSSETSDSVRPKSLSLTRTAVPRGEVRVRLVETLLAELLDEVTNVLASDPIRVERLAALFGVATTHERLPLLMTKADYADRLNYSVRKLDDLIAAGLPTLGRGRALRIPVTEADRWVHMHLSWRTDEETEIDIEAMAAARRRSGRARQ